MDLNDTQNIIKGDYNFYELNKCLDEILKRYPNIKGINIKINSETKKMYVGEPSEVFYESTEAIKKEFEFVLGNETTTINTTFEIPIKKDK